MMLESKAKIFIAYHRISPLLNGDCFVPIHVGREVAFEKSKDGCISDQNYKWLKTNMIGDNTGDNISYLNREFCEATLIYWIWKHLDDYAQFPFIGLMQYRRHFIFNDFFEKSRNDVEKVAYGCVHVSKVTSDYSNKIGLTEENVLSKLRETEIILPIAGDLRHVGVTNIWDDYVSRIPGVHIDDLLALVETVGKFENKLQKELIDYLDSPFKLMYNMFILPREEFKKFCSFLFPLLFSTYEMIDSTLYSANGRRTMGYLAEILYGFYFTKVISNQVTKRNLGITFLDKV